MAACTGTASIARLNNDGRMFWQEIEAGEIRTQISSSTQRRQINITASATLVRNSYAVRFWGRSGRTSFIPSASGETQTTRLSTRRVEVRWALLQVPA